MDESAHYDAPASDLGIEPMEIAADQFGSVTENTVLRRLLLNEIRRDGPITFYRFMQTALYHPLEGYYRIRPAIGAHGDYLTSPELHPLFGALLSRQIAEFWSLLGRPHRFRLVEMGAGMGTLARSMLATMPADLRAATSYVIIEPGSLQRQRQTATLGALAEQVDWVADLAQIAPQEGCVISNELVDSFPVHRVTVVDDRLQEIYVGERDGCFIDIVGEPSTPALAGYFERLGLMPGDRCLAEVNLDALDWMRTVAGTLSRGFVLTLDYGYSAARLYAPWRRQGTLLSFYQHTSDSNPYARPGRQDLTAHVDFTSLVRAGTEAGLQPLGYSNQHSFLSSLGIHDALGRGTPAGAELEEYLARRQAVAALLDPEGLGRINVLAQGNAVGNPTLRGFPNGRLEELL